MKELFEKYINREALIFLGGLQVSVTILDIKKAYGRERFLVSPVKGKGEIWVESVTL
jgi:uncharacterized protein (AIM24 family)